jgi:hypothetical protein
MVTEADLNLFLDAAELSLNRGDSSIYDILTLGSNPVYQEFGLGSLLSLYARPVVYEPKVKPLVYPTANLGDLVSKRVLAPTVVIFDKDKWVIIFLVSNLVALANGSNSKKSQLLSVNAAIKEYRRSNYHMGKYAKQSEALEVQDSIRLLYRSFEIEQLGLAETREFGPLVTSLNVSYSMDGSNQIQFTVIDKNYAMMEKNFFMNRRVIRYRGAWYEIGVVEVGPGPGGSPQITVTAWDEAIQKMKRDKNPESISGSSVYEYAFNAARKYGLQFVAEKSNKTQTINKGSGNNADENVWSVLKGSATQDEFVLYVMDGVMIYGSQKWLMWKFGTDSKTTVNAKTKKSTTRKYSRLFYGFEPGYVMPRDAEKFKVMEYPTIRQSENDPLEGDGAVVVAKPNGCIIRPGHTVVIGPKPTMFRGGYLVTEVAFSEGTPEPVSISFRTPEKPKPETEDD